MAQYIRSVRGMHDILPGDSARWHWLEARVRRLVASYGYREIRMPVVERTELFKRSIGEVTDIVEKEMYTFEDRNGESLTLRPEGTAGCVRAGIEHGLLHNQQQRLWYMGPMFRHERPQKGRYRQFHQIGVEVFGIAEPEVEAELIAMNARLWRELGIEDVRLEINSLGSPQSRAEYRERLVAYFRRHEADLDEDSRRRLDTNPLRILDSKHPDMQALIAGAPSLLDHLDLDSQAHFDALCAMLDEMAIPYRVNPRLVRGLDYYTRTVFEWITGSLGAQGTICAGGRYDGLVAQLGGRDTPAAGFALGIERLLALMRPAEDLAAADAPHAFLVPVGEGTLHRALALAEALRRDVPGLRLQTNLGGGSFKAQLKRADRSGAPYALLLGEDELAQGTLGFKPLRGQGAQETLALEAVAERLALLVSEEREATGLDA